MSVKSRQMYEASDGTLFFDEVEARNHELVLELTPMAQAFIEESGVGHKMSRKRATELTVAFAVQLLSPPAPEQEPVDE